MWARPDQLWRPGPELITLIMAGRGWGKTRTGAEATHHAARYCTIAGGRRDGGGGGQLGLGGRTSGHIRTEMIEGPAGLLNTGDPSFRPAWEPSKRQLVWPCGCRGITLSGDSPGQFRGPNLGYLWADELAHWLRLEECWEEGAEHMVRIDGTGQHARTVITTTPRPSKLLKGLLIDPDVRLVYGSTLDNRANLSHKRIARLYRRFRGTRLEAQELKGMLLEDAEHAPWEREWIERCLRIEMPRLVKVIVGVDPAGGGGTKKSDETGIVVIGLGTDDRIYVLEDLTRKCSSAIWGKVAVEAAKRWHADSIACERNWGGDQVKTIIQQIAPSIRVKLPVATRDKGSRADMVAPYWNRRQVYHVGDPRHFVQLEDQMCTYDPTLPRTAQDSPDRMDALVWATLELVGDGSDRQTLRNLAATEDLWDEIERDVGQDLDHDDLMGLIESAFGRLAA